jgi:type IV secretory pathway TraG/TraD family ATPase VirD4
MLRKLFFAVFLAGLLYMASAMYACYGRLFPQIKPAPAASVSKPTESRFAKIEATLTAYTKVILASPYADQIWDFAPTFCAPGLAVLTFLFIETDSPVEWGIAFVLSWWFWGTLLRLAFIIPARFFGIGYAPSRFLYFLWLLPPWRPFYGMLRPVIRWARSLFFGRAETDRWASLLEVLYLVYRRRKRQIPLGRINLFHLGFWQPVGIGGDRHIAMVGAPGSSKTTTLIAMLAQHLGNIFCIDCGAECINAIGPYLAAQGKRVINIDFYKMADDFPISNWNAVLEIADAVKRYGPAAAVEFAMTLAEALIKIVPGVNEWVYKDAIVVMTGLLLYVHEYAAPENRTLTYVRDLLMHGLREGLRPQDDAFEALCAELMTKLAHNGAIAAAGVMLKRSMGGRGEGKSPVLSTIIEALSWLASPSVSARCKTSDFLCHDLVTGKIALFVVLPVTEMQGKLSGYVRALTIMCMYAAQRAVKKRPKNKTLYACDEFTSMGYHPIFEVMAGVGRKYSAQLLTIMQTVGQLKAVYHQNWSLFLGTAEATLWFNNGDLESRQYLSDLLGSKTQEVKVEGGRLSALRPHPRREDRKLLSPGQLREFLKTNIIVTRADDRPIKLKADPFFRALPVTMYEPHKFYPETRARAFTRRILRLFTGRKALSPAHPTTPHNQERTV